jgi:hypothetical protein
MGQSNLLWTGIPDKPTKKFRVIATSGRGDLRLELDCSSGRFFPLVGGAVSGVPG